MNIIKHIIILFYFFNFSIHNLFSQLEPKKKNNEIFLNARVGIGPLSYAGGPGLCIEFGKKNFSGHISSGYTPVVYGAASINYGGGIRYYFKINKKFNVRIGIYTGELLHYYDNRIKNENYNPIVYGGALTAGIDFLYKFFIIDFGCGYVPRFAVFNKSSNPNFDVQFIYPSVGIGTNLLDFQKKKKQKEKEKTIPQFY